ncbi:cyclic GMP-AMP synthase-like receptor 2 isoform X1 [Argopecten irradians]|uniref:cyclic GMP-AMP synthase-like receptor 2 isoform X1 n=2 Tax=Argopecten irradians TaxID=31199 RepID=UPI00370FA775
MEMQQSHMMTDQGEQGKSWMLYHILDRYIGSRQVVAIRRKTTLLFDQIAQRTKHPVKIFSTGSSAEGMEMKGSDMDYMMIDSYVKVLSGDEDVRCVEDSPEKTVFVMRDTNSRPGYVILQLVNLGEEGCTHMADSIVSVGDQQFISSEIYTHLYAESGNMETHGPAVSLMKEHDDNEAKGDFDFSHSFPCTSWPRQANEWRNRPRLYGWPNETLRYQIVKGGCHLVPVGDKTSSGAFLQWRISFTTAERKLIHSLTHVQFLVYGLLKYLLKQIADALKQLLGDTEVVSSYILKTTVFYAVENTPESFWKEENIFHGFMFCIKILIYWVHAGYCPNYFISNNNMIFGKVHGENQKRLLSFLVELYGITWDCLSIGEYIHPSLGQLVSRVRNGEWQIAQPTPTQLERDHDLKTFLKIFPLANNSFVLPITLKRLTESSTDLDEFIGYFTTTKALCAGGITIFEKHHATAKGNKQKYKALRISKRFMAPFSSVCTSPGLLLLATFHYQTGNYMKAIELCEQMISSFKMFVGDGSFVSKDIEKYKLI